MDHPSTDPDVVELQEYQQQLDFVARVSARLPASDLRELELDVEGRKAFLLDRIRSLQDRLRRHGKLA